MTRGRSKPAKFVVLLFSMILIVGTGIGVASFLQTGLSPLAGANSSPETITALMTTTAFLPGLHNSIGAGPFTGDSISNGYTPPSTFVLNPGGNSQAAGGQAGQFRAPAGSSVEFFANVSLAVSSPQVVVGKIEAIAIEHGGYLSYSTIANDSAYTIMRVPASEYQRALGEIEGLGSMLGLVTTSNDVTIKLTDLNATLQSLLAEKASLLKILGQSTSINSTLQVESQLQLIDAETNSIMSQILNTQRLVDYSTIATSLSKTASKALLSANLAATPRSGLNPLAVTFHTVVKGGTPPYMINYNFGDGTSAEGDIVIHEYTTAGDFNATVIITDSSGSVIESSALIRVASQGAGVAFSQFIGAAGDLLVRVVEGIVEVAVVTIPIGLVLAAVVVPLSRKLLRSGPQGAEKKA